MPRSFHFIPGHQRAWFDQAVSREADVCVFDLEDAVPQAQKPEARRHIGEFLESTDPARWFVRIHDPRHREFLHDAPLLRRFATLGVVLPKYQGQSDLKELEDSVTLGERRVIPLIESFAGLRRVSRELTDRPAPLYALGLGFEDMLAECPHPRNQLGDLVQRVRTELALLCRGCGLLGIDGISAEFNDMARFEEDCRTARAAGLQAKFSIHPRQVPVIHQVYSPDSAMVAWAHDVLKCSGVSEESGYAWVGNQLITPPKIKKAKALLRLKEQSGDEN